MNADRHARFMARMDADQATLDARSSAMTREIQASATLFNASLLFGDTILACAVQTSEDACRLATHLRQASERLAALEMRVLAEADRLCGR